MRDLARKRMQLVQSCTTHVLAIENIMARQLGGRMTSNQIKRLTDDTIDSLPSLDINKRRPVRSAFRISRTAMPAGNPANHHSE